MTGIVVATWNIQFGIEIDRAAELIASHTELSRADILFFQELDATGAARLGELLGLHVVYESACVHPQTGRDFGNAILTRHPATERRVVPLPHRATVQGTPRLALGVRTTVAGAGAGAGAGPVPVAAWCTHTETPAMRRERRIAQFRTLADAVADDDTDRLVVGGDFNTVTRRGIATLSSLMAEANTRRVAPADDVTLRRGGRPLALDHLFARGVRTSSAGVMAAQGASDHDALWAVFALDDIG